MVKVYRTSADSSDGRVNLPLHLRGADISLVRYRWGTKDVSPGCSLEERFSRRIELTRRDDGYRFSVALFPAIKADTEGQWSASEMRHGEQLLHAFGRLRYWWFPAAIRTSLHAIDASLVLRSQPNISTYSHLRDRLVFATPRSLYDPALSAYLDIPAREIRPEPLGELLSRFRAGGSLFSTLPRVTIHYDKRS